MVGDGVWSCDPAEVGDHMPYALRIVCMHIIHYNTYEQTS